MSDVLRHLVWTNPVLEEAGRARRKFFRSAGGPGRGLTRAAVWILGLFYLWLLVTVMQNGDGMTPFLLYLQLVTVTLALPTSVYGAISGERERATWEALILTRLTPAQIVVGKLLWRISGLLSLMVLFLPLLLMGDAAKNFSARTPLFLPELMTLAWGIFLCAFGLWVSACTRRAVTSAALVFVSLLALLALAPALLSMFSGYDISANDYSGNGLAWAVMHVNPFYVLGRMLTPIVTPSNDDQFYLGQGLSNGPFQIGLYLFGGAAFVLLARRRLSQSEEPRRRS